MKKVLSVFAFCAMGAMAADWTGVHHGHEMCAQEGDHGRVTTRRLRRPLH